MARQHLKNGKSPGEYGITAELLKAGGKPVPEVLQKLFNSDIHGGTTPEAWSRGAVVLFCKKGDNALLMNYRPISLLSRVYVLFRESLKITFNVHVTPMPVVVGSTKFEVVDEYVYHNIQIVRLGKSNFDREVNRRIQFGWAAFGKLRHIFSSGIPQNLKTKLYNQCVLPVMTDDLWN
ncbi:unnamed protein product [Parnassius mnemosyne]|uniref:Uncharacterized protein n=1 Tax=Parnassius mnemosyne TaxID=213953 RepID=A0AAV1LYN5_9NEOP